MTKQTRGSNRNGRKGDPNQDVQPWLGWVAAMLVVVIVVVAVAMGMERTNDQRNGAAEVRMTPLVGGMEVPVATETGAAMAVASEVTPLPEAISGTGAITMVTVITGTNAHTATDIFPSTGEMTPTESVTTTEIMSMTGPLSATENVSASVAMTVTELLSENVEITATAGVAPGVEVTATLEATNTPRPMASATTLPTVTATLVVRVFQSGETVVASEGRVEVHADASVGALVLDTFGTGVVLEVLDVGGDFESYPVEMDGHGWVRVRAADGLVGWVMTDQVEAQ